MSIKALYFQVDELGKVMKSSKKRFKWKFSIDEKLHFVELEFSFLTGKRKIFLDGNILFESSLPLTQSFQYPFNLENYALNILQQGEQFELRINNKVFSHLYTSERTKHEFQWDDEAQQSKKDDKEDQFTNFVNNNNANYFNVGQKMQLNIKINKDNQPQAEFGKFTTVTKPAQQVSVTQKEKSFLDFNNFGNFSNNANTDQNNQPHKQDYSEFNFGDFSKSANTNNNQQPQQEQKIQSQPQQEVQTQKKQIEEVNLLDMMDEPPKQTQNATQTQQQQEKQNNKETQQETKQKSDLSWDQAFSDMKSSGNQQQTNNQQQKPQEQANQQSQQNTKQPPQQQKQQIDIMNLYNQVPTNNMSQYQYLQQLQQQQQPLNPLQQQQLLYYQQQQMYYQQQMMLMKNNQGQQIPSMPFNYNQFQQPMPNQILQQQPIVPNNQQPIQQQQQQPVQQQQQQQQEAVKANPFDLF